MIRIDIPEPQYNRTISFFVDVDENGVVCTLESRIFGFCDAEKEQERIQKYKQSILDAFRLGTDKLPFKQYSITNLREPTYGELGAILLG